MVTSAPAVSIEDLPTLAGSSSRALGAYYTPSVAADFLAAWVVRREGDRVLEPSIGDGVFLGALAARQERLGTDIEIWGVELAADTYAATLARGLLPRSHARLGDFLATDPFPVDAVVGNPPYVRLRHLPGDQRATAVEAARRTLGAPMDPAGSVWMAFVLHATRFLVRGGRLGLVLPHDLTYVRYARPLWQFLARSFGHLKIVRVRQRMFPEILQEVVLLLADDHQGTTESVDFSAYGSLASLASGAPELTRRIPLDDIVAGERPFLTALLDPEVELLLKERIELATIPARDLVTFNIGYVCGDKRFFHPDSETVQRFGIPDASLRPALTSSRQLRGAGIRTTTLPRERLNRIFLPPAPKAGLRDGELSYLELGASEGVTDRYKCQVRDPWYVTPGVKVPDVLVPVFTERPAMIQNDAALVASNSLLCGYLRQGTADALLTAWFTSLTVLQFELQIHALGGGVLVLVPREAGNVRLPIVRSGRRHLDRLHQLMLSGQVDQAFEAGDRFALQDQLGFSPADVATIRAAAVTLASWRTTARPD